MLRIERDTPCVTRITKNSILDETVFKLDLVTNSLKIHNYDGHIEIKQEDIAALFDLLAPFDYPLGKQTYFTYVPMPVACLTACELVEAAHCSQEEMVALNICIYDRPKEDYVISLGESRAEALYLQESDRFGIMCHDYGYTRWLKGFRSLEASMQRVVDDPYWLKYPQPPPVKGFEHLR